MPDIRLISDENISWRLKRSLPTWQILPSNEIKIEQKLSDLSIWLFAKSHDYHILTFDEDFTDLENLYGHPPKVIWLRTGNLTTMDIASKLLLLEDAILDFLSSIELGVFEIT